MLHCSASCTETLQVARSGLGLEYQGVIHSGGGGGRGYPPWLSFPHPYHFRCTSRCMDKISTVLSLSLYVISYETK